MLFKDLPNGSYFYCLSGKFYKDKNGNSLCISSNIYANQKIFQFDPLSDINKGNDMTLIEKYNFKFAKSEEVLISE